MSKIKRKSSRHGEELIVTCKKGQQLAQREYQLLSTGQIPGFLRPEAQVKGNVPQLSFPVSGLISLREFLQMTPLNKDCFAGLLQEILHLLKTADAEHLSAKLIQYDVDLMMVDPSTFNVLMLYVPIQPYEENGTIRDAMQGILNNACFLDATADDYVARFAQLFADGVLFSVYSLEEYAGSLQWQPDPVSAGPVCPRCGAGVGEEDVFCGYCGSRIRQEPKPKKSGRYTAVAGDALEAVPETQTGQDSYSIGENENGVVTVFKAGGIKPKAPVRRAWLTRAATGERIAVDHVPFYIGKKLDGNDYCIQGNNTVSRMHAQILKEQDNYFLSDLNSTNGTYTDNQRLAPQTPAMLQNGTVIHISNEKFVFTISEGE